MVCSMLSDLSVQVKEKVSLMLDWFPNPVHVPIYTAHKKGYFEAQGLDVKILTPDDPTDPLKLTAAGKIQFAVNYQTIVTMSRNQDIPVVSVGTLVQHPLNCILFFKSSGIETPADFKGRRIGFSIEPLFKVMFETIAEKAGLEKADYELTHIGHHLEPLLDGQVDAICGTFRNFEAIQVGLEGKEVGIFPFEDYGIPDYYELVLIAHSNLIKEQPTLVEGFFEGLDNGIQQTLAEPEACLAEFIKQNPELDNELNRQAFKATLPYFRGSPAQELSYWEKFQAFLQERGLIEKTTPVQEMVWKP